MLLLNTMSSMQGLLDHNILQNRPLMESAGGCVEARPFVWGESTLQDLPAEWQRPDLVIAADVRPCSCL